MRQGAGKTAPRNAVDGVLLLDKPLGLSSNQALQQAKRLLGARKAGHAGTLDPAATGLLVLCFGEATKLAGIGLDEDKTYEAWIQLGSATDTGDAEGKVVQERPFRGSDADIDAALARYRGPITQIPPMVSALKRDGKPLYAYARAGIEVERAPRQVIIHSLDLLERRGDRLRVRVRCSKGTYIRVLAEQIGAVLDSCAHLCALRRTAAGGLDVAAAQTLDALEAQSPVQRAGALMPPETLVLSMSCAKLSAEEAAQIKQGRSLPRPQIQPGPLRLHGPDGRLLALAEARDGGIHPRRLLLDQENVVQTPHLSLEEQDDSPIQ